VGIERGWQTVSAARRFAIDPEKFEAEMNRTCPVHGLRRFGNMVVLRIVKPGMIIDEKSVRLLQLVDQYKRRLSQLPESSSYLEYEPEEL
jgi:hypothetical protein